MVGPPSCWAGVPSCPAGAWLVSEGPEGPESTPFAEGVEDGDVWETGSCEVLVAGAPVEVSCDDDTPAWLFVSDGDVEFDVGVLLDG